MARTAMGMGIVLAMAAVPVMVMAQSNGADAQRPIPFKTTAKVWVDEAGVPQRVEASEELPAGVRETIDSMIGRWRFKPAAVNGQPRSGVTYLRLNACAIVSESGKLNLAIGNNGIGPIIAGNASGFLTPPRYPVEAVKQMVDGEMIATWRVLPDGTAQWMSIEPKAGASRRNSQLRYFEPALRQWVAQLRYLPEEVDGHPVATVIQTPVEFRLSGDPVLEHMNQLRTSTSQECVAAMQAEAASTSPIAETAFTPLSDGS